MSRESVELVRGIFDAFRRRDIAAGLEAYSDDVEWTTASDEPDPRTFRGREGLEGLVQGWLDTWEDNLFEAAEPQEFIEVGDHVVVPMRAMVRGKASGVPVEILETYDFRIAGGKVAEVQEYRTKEQALEALGVAN
jgi:ketosteroid isomerase-like protein